METTVDAYCMYESTGVGLCAGCVSYWGKNDFVIEQEGD
jgi:hypothetical protein